MNDHATTRFIRPFAVCVCGVPGVGKTTLISAHVGGDRAGPDRQLSGSSVIREVIAPHSVRDFDGWPVEARTTVRHEAIRRLQALRDALPRALLVDGHFTLRNARSGAIEPVFTAEDRRFYDALVHIDATAEAIYCWRAADPRDRGATTLELLEEELLAERNAAAEIASEMRVPLLTIETAEPISRLTQLRKFLGHISASLVR